MHIQHNGVGMYSKVEYISKLWARLKQTAVRQENLLRQNLWTQLHYKTETSEQYKKRKLFNNNEIQKNEKFSKKNYFTINYPYDSI